MGTPKRERQKANKAQREQELIRSASRARATRIGILVGGAIIAIFGLVFLVGQFTGDDATPDGDAAGRVDDPVDAAPVGDATIEDTTTEVPAVVAPVATDPVETPEIPEVSVNDAEVVPEGCPAIIGTDDQTQTFDAAPPMCLDPAISYTAVVTTNLGVIEWDLDQEAAPDTVNSFVFLARNKYFNGTVCHRVIQDFVVQCGDPTATGTGGPGYTTDDELPAAGAYQIGSIAMANSGPDTQGSQFFIISGPNGVALPPSYSLFGQIPDDDIGTVTQMNARGSLDPSGTPSSPIELIDVQIATS